MAKAAMSQSKYVWKAKHKDVHYKYANGHSLDSGYYEVGFTNVHLAEFIRYSIKDGVISGIVGTKWMGPENEPKDATWTPIKNHEVRGEMYWTGERWRWETNELNETNYHVCCIGKKLRP